MIVKYAHVEVTNIKVCGPITNNNIESKTYFFKIKKNHSSYIKDYNMTKGDL